MSDFDRNASTAGAGRNPGWSRRNRSGPALLYARVYNNMTIGLALTGVVALGVHMLASQPIPR